jgi:UDP-N-acetylmuramate--alanine ligase
MKHAVKHIHFVGVGGAGMSGIAEILHNLGYTVSGSDQSDSATSRRLASLGIRIAVGHDAANIVGAEAVVTSTAVKGDNPEVIAARAKHVPVVPRAVMLELMRLKQGIAIAGTHGKTTTTSLVTSVLAEAGVDPTFVIGGRLNAAGANSRLGSGDYIVVEADESDASFLNLLPVMAVVTNIDADHMDTYGHDFAKLKSAFVEFIHRMPFYGAAILCSDDAGVRSIMPMISRPVVTYGFGDDAMVRAVEIEARAGTMAFTVQRRNGVQMPDLRVTLNLPGLHNVLNALATIAVATELELPDAPVVKGLADFRGVDRRFRSAGRCGRHVHLDRRLRPPPGRDGRDHRRRARGLPRPAPRARVPAAPLHPHPRLFRGLCEGHRHGRCGVARRGLCGGRSADRGCRWQGLDARIACCRQGRSGLRRRDCRDARNDRRPGA